MATEKKTRQPQADAKGCWKARYTLCLLCMLGLASVFAMRVNLSVAIVAMVNHTALAEHRSHLAVNSGDIFGRDDTCPGELATHDNESSSANGAFLWDEQMQGEILAAYFYGYTVGHVPGGMLADRFGGKLVVGLGVLVTALFSLVTPPFAWVSAELVFVGRFLQGLGQGGMIPAIQCMMAKWVPQQERGRFSILYCGTFIGIVFAMALTGVMCEMTAGWPLSFYFFGALGVVWCVPWFLLIYDSPAEHPRIDPDERAYIEASLGEAPDRRKLKVPWRPLLLCPALWSCCLVQFGVGWMYVLVMTALPLYLANIMHFDLHSNGLLSAIPYVTGGVGSVLIGFAFQSAMRSSCISRLSVFRIGNATSMLVPSLMMVGVALVGCNSVAVIAMLALCSVCLAFNYAVNYNNIMVLAPNFSGTLFGIANTFANVTGVIVPYIVAAFTFENFISCWEPSRRSSRWLRKVTYKA